MKQSYTRFHLQCCPLDVSEDSLRSASYAYAASALFSGQSHRLTSTLIKKYLSFSSVKTSRKSAIFRCRAKDNHYDCLNPYPVHYKPALAFSGLLYPLLYQLTLRFAFLSKFTLPGEHRAYPVDHLGDTIQGGWRPYPGGDFGVAASCVL